MDWVLLTYAVIFGVIGVYLASLWRRAQRVKKQLDLRQ